MFYIKTSDDVKIAVYDYSPDCDCKKTVFLVHGWPLSHKIYEYQIDLLLSCGYRVVAIDLRGFGQSDAPGCNYSYDRMAEDIYNIVCAMKLRNFILVGFSMGGAISLRYMRKFKGFGVCKLILLAAAAPSATQQPDFPYGLTKESWDELICLASTDRPKLCETFVTKQLFACSHSRASMNWFKDIALSASGIGTIQTGVSLKDEECMADLKAVRVPTRIIHGEKDVVVSNELVKIQNECIADSKLYTLENSGHGVMYDELKKFNQYFMRAIER